MQVNWARGMKRLAWSFIAMVWVISLAANFRNGAAAVGEAIAYLLIFTLVFMLLYRGAAWVIAGFSRN